MQSKIVYTLIKKVCEYRVMNYKETPLEKNIIITMNIKIIIENYL